MTNTLLHMAGNISMAASFLLAVVTLNHRLFARFAASPKAFAILAVATIGVGTDAVDLLNELSRSGLWTLGWHGLMLAMDAGFIITVSRRLIDVRRTRVQSAAPISH